MLVLLNKPHFCVQLKQFQKTKNFQFKSFSKINKFLSNNNQTQNVDLILNTNNQFKSVFYNHKNNESILINSYEQITLPVLGIDIISAYGEIT